MDDVFRALADPTRRSLLDELFREDGQTLSALEARFDITRFGVMKHLKQLEEAGLVVTRRRGREKLHFLNPVPIRLVHDRWVSKYAEPWVATLSGLKQRLESPMEKVFEIYIRTTPERLWEAIIDPDIRSKYNFGAAMVVPELKAGAHFEMTAPKAGAVLGEGEILEVDPPRRLVHTMDGVLQRRGEGRGDVARHVGDRARRVTRAISPSPTTNCVRAPTPSSTEAGPWCCRASRRGSSRASCSPRPVRSCGPERDAPLPAPGRLRLTWGGAPGWQRTAMCSSLRRRTPTEGRV